MNREQFYTYLENPASLNNKSLEAMEDVLAEYPYFQAAHLLYLKNLHNTGHLKFSKQLRISSAFVSNRKVLYNYLHPYPEDRKEEIPGKTILPSIKDSIADNLSSGKEQVASSEKKHQPVGGNREWLGHELLKKLDEEPKHLLDLNGSEKPLQKIEKEVPSDLHVPTLPTKLHKPKGESPIASGVAGEITNEKHSFDEWLTLLSKPNSGGMIQHPPSEEKEKTRFSKQNNQQALIDNFIKANPKIASPHPNDKPQKDISESSHEENDDFITDTLAKIYINQKHYNKALLAYEKLSLKYPEKSIYFAHQIEKIRDLKNE